MFRHQKALDGERRVIKTIMDRGEKEMTETSDIQ